MKLRSTLLFAAASLTASSLAPIAAATSALLAAATLPAQAADTWTMSELVSSGGTLGTGVIQDESYKDDTVYTFTGEGAITNISNTSLLEAVKADSGYITIAAWIKVENYDGIKSVFSYGAQSDGFKFTTQGSGLTFTNKGVSDYNSHGHGSLSNGEWELIALTLNLSNLSAGNRYWLTDVDGRYYTVSLGKWTSPAESAQKFAIGSGNYNENRENFVGQIANLTVFTSDTMPANNSSIFEKLGDMPEVTVDTLFWAGTTDSHEWNTTSENWEKEEKPVVFKNGVAVVFDASEAVSKTVVVNEEVSAQRVSIEDNYTFSGKGTVTVSNAGLTIKENASLTINKDLTLALGKEANGTLNKNILGDGTISWGNTANNHGTTVNLSESFKGTLKLSGNIRTIENSTDSLVLGGTSKIIADGLWFWGNSGVKEISADIEVTESYGMGDAAQSNFHVNGAGGGINVTGNFLAEGKVVKFAQGTNTLAGETNTIGTLHVSEGTTTISGTTNTIGSIFQTGGIVVIEGKTTASQFAGASTRGTAGTLNISSSGVLTITGSSNSTDGNKGSFQLSNYPGSTAVNVHGVLNVQNAGISNRDGSGTITIHDGGEVNFGVGITLTDRNNAENTITLNAGGRLNIGVGADGVGIENDKELVFNLSGGTVGALSDSWSSDRDLTLSGAVTFDTTKRTLNTSGKAVETSQKSTITLGGAISGGGSLIVDGIGVLKLTKNVDLSGITITEKATLELGFGGELSQNISGGGLLVKSGTAELTHSGSFEGGRIDVKEGIFTVNTAKGNYKSVAISKDATFKAVQNVSVETIDGSEGGTLAGGSPSVQISVGSGKFAGTVDGITLAKTGVGKLDLAGMKSTNDAVVRVESGTIDNLTLADGGTLNLAGAGTSDDDITLSNLTLVSGTICIDQLFEDVSQATITGTLAGGSGEASSVVTLEFLSYGVQTKYALFTFSDESKAGWEKLFGSLSADGKFSGGSLTLSVAESEGKDVFSWGEGDDANTLYFTDTREAVTYYWRGSSWQLWSGNDAWTTNASATVGNTECDPRMTAVFDRASVSGDEVSVMVADELGTGDVYAGEVIVDIGKNSDGENKILRLGDSGNSKFYAANGISIKSGRLFLQTSRGDFYTGAINIGEGGVFSVGALMATAPSELTLKNTFSDIVTTNESTGETSRSGGTILVENDTLTLTLSGNRSEFTGTLDVDAGTVKLVNSSGTENFTIDIADRGTVIATGGQVVNNQAVDWGAYKTRELNLKNVTGAGVLIIDSQDGKPTDKTFFTLNVGGDFSGKIQLNSLDLSIGKETTHFPNVKESSIASDVTIVLNDAWLNFFTEEKTFANDIEITDKGGAVRVYSSNTGATLSGDISGEGTLTIKDGGTLHITGAVGKADAALGALTLDSGNLNISGENSSINISGDVVLNGGAETTSSLTLNTSGTIGGNLKAGNTGKAVSLSLGGNLSVGGDLSLTNSKITFVGSAGVNRAVVNVGDQLTWGDENKIVLSDAFRKSVSKSADLISFKSQSGLINGNGNVIDLSEIFTDDKTYGRRKLSLSVSTNNDGSGKLSVISSGSLIWNADVATWADGANDQWTFGDSTSEFQKNDYVEFLDAGTVVANGTINTSGVVFNLAGEGAAFTVTGTGTLADAAGDSLSNAGLMVFSGNITIDATVKNEMTSGLYVYGGSLTVEAESGLGEGTVNIGSEQLGEEAKIVLGFEGDVSNVFDIVNASAVLENAQAITLTSAMTGGGGLTKRGAGTLDIQRGSDLDTLTVASGKMVLSGEAETAVKVKNVVVHSELSVTNGGGDDGAKAAFNSITLSNGTMSVGEGEGVYRATKVSSSGNSSLNGTLHVADDSTISVSAGTLAMSGGVTGAKTLTKSGIGTLAFNGENVNIDADFVLAGGTLSIGQDAEFKGEFAVPDGKGTKGDIAATISLSTATGSVKFAKFDSAKADQWVAVTGAYGLADAKATVTIGSDNEESVSLGNLIIGGAGLNYSELNSSVTVDVYAKNIGARLIALGERSTLKLNATNENKTVSADAVIVGNGIEGAVLNLSSGTTLTLGGQHNGENVNVLQVAEPQGTGTLKVVGGGTLSVNVNTYSENSAPMIELSDNSTFNLEVATDTQLSLNKISTTASSTGTVSKSGLGTLRISGKKGENGNSTYPGFVGEFSVKEGKAIFEKTAKISAESSTLSVSDGAESEINGTDLSGFTLTGAGTTTTKGGKLAAISSAGNVSLVSGMLSVAGNISESKLSFTKGASLATIGDAVSASKTTFSGNIALDVDAGTATYDSTNTISSATSVTLDANSAETTGELQAAYSGVLTKKGVGTWTVTDYTLNGALAVEAGELIWKSAKLGDSAISIATGATLQVNGVASGNELKGEIGGAGTLEIKNANLTLDTAAATGSSWELLVAENSEVTVKKALPGDLSVSGTAAVAKLDYEDNNFDSELSVRNGGTLETSENISIVGDNHKIDGGTVKVASGTLTQKTSGVQWLGSSTLDIETGATFKMDLSKDAKVNSKLSGAGTFTLASVSNSAVEVGIGGNVASFGGNVDVGENVTAILSDSLFDNAKKVDVKGTLRVASVKGGTLKSLSGNGNVELAAEGDDIRRAEFKINDLNSFGGTTSVIGGALVLDASALGGLSKDKVKIGGEKVADYRETDNGQGMLSGAFLKLENKSASVADISSVNSVLNDKAGVIFDGAFTAGNTLKGGLFVADTNASLTLAEGANVDGNLFVASGSEVSMNVPGAIKSGSGALANTATSGTTIAGNLTLNGKITYTVDAGTKKGATLIDVSGETLFRTNRIADKALLYLDLANYQGSLGGMRLISGYDAAMAKTINDRLTVVDSAGETYQLQVLANGTVAVFGGIGDYTAPKGLAELYTLLANSGSMLGMDLNSLGDAAAKTEMLVELSPISFGSLLEMQSGFASLENDLLRERLEQRRYERTDVFDSTVSFKPFINVVGASREGSGNGTESSNYDISHTGVVGGFDFALSKTSMLGLSLGLDWAEATVHGGGKHEADTSRFGVYGMTLFENNYLGYGLSFGGTSFNTQRRVGGETLTGDTNGNDMNASITFGSGWTVADKYKVDVAPYVGFDLGYTRTNSFEEKGSSDTALAVDAMERWSLRGKIGAAVSWRATARLRLAVDAAFSHEFLDSEADIDAAFASGELSGSKFSSKAYMMDENTFQIGPRLDYRINDTWSASAGYTYETDFADTTTHAANIGVRARF